MFLVETRLKSRSTEPLIDFLGFRVQKLFPKTINLTKYQFLIFREIYSFWGHNFWTQNPRKSIKGSNNPDFSPISTKNMSEVRQSNGLGLGPDDLGQKCLWSLFHLYLHPQKKRTQHQTFFSVQTHESFECSNSFLAQSTGELWNSKVAGK